MKILISKKGITLGYVQYTGKFVLVEAEIFLNPNQTKVILVCDYFCARDPQFRKMSPVCNW